MKERVFRYTICPIGTAGYLAVYRENSLFLQCFRESGAEPVLLQSLPESCWNRHYTYEDAALFREGGNVPPIWARSNGADMMLLGCAFLQQRAFLMAPENRGIRSVFDLPGKRVACSVRSALPVDFYRATVQRGVETALAAQGMRPSDVEWVFLPVEQEYSHTNRAKSDLGQVELEAVEQGRADCIYAGGPFAQRVLQAGRAMELYEITKSPEVLLPVNNVYPCVLTVSRSFAHAHPELVVRYVAEVLRGARWAAQNESEVIRLFSAQMHGSAEEVRRAMPQGFHRKLEPALSPKHLLAIESQKRFLFDHGYISRDFDVQQWAEPYFLDEAKRLLQQEAAK